MTRTKIRLAQLRRMRTVCMNRARQEKNHICGKSKSVSFWVREARSYNRDLVIILKCQTAGLRLGQ